MMFTPLALLLSFVHLAKASLPWGSIPTQEIQESGSVSFDPLSLLAVLWNPRASASASRLYSQPDRTVFRWPHTMQVGALLTPVSVLVGHLTRNYQSIHPAVDMFMGNVASIRVKSTIGGSLNLFPTLPVAESDSAILSCLNFKSSILPANDIAVVMFGPDVDQLLTKAEIKTKPKYWLQQKLILVTEVGMGILVCAGLVFSALLGDMWAVALFWTYLLHWVASTVISFNRLIVPDINMRIVPDPGIVFAIYERPSGGLVVFKGPQDVMEKWARTRWTFSETVWHKAVHWVWMLTGSVAALASVACMVNMQGKLQLGFLGMLLYASAAELWLTVLANHIQQVSTTTTGPPVPSSSTEVKGNDKRFKSIIQASLGIDPYHRLDTLDWIRMDLLPPTKVFQALLDSMRYLNGVGNTPAASDDTTTAAAGPALEQAKVIFDSECGKLAARDTVTKDLIWIELVRAWTAREHASETALDNTTHTS